MTVRLDRALQGRILTALAAVYPERIELDEALPDVDPQHVVMNVHYLCEHGLAETKWSQLLSGPPIAGDVGITARGLDFLADDGGLSAILGVVTVRLHEDTLKSLLIERIEASPEPETVKKKLKDKVQSMSDEALNTATSELVKAAIARMPDLVPWLMKTLGGA